MGNETSGVYEKKRNAFIVGKWALMANLSLAPLGDPSGDVVVLSLGISFNGGSQLTQGAAQWRS